jgi:hypothetical protein
VRSAAEQRRRHFQRFSHCCRFCALPLAAKFGYSLLRLTKSGFGGFAMKYLALILTTCAVAAMATPDQARAFDIQGQNATVPEGVQPFGSLANQGIDWTDMKGSSLAMPYIGKSDSSTFISDYGNSITIPGPGVDKAAPVWAYR